MNYTPVLMERFSSWQRQRKLLVFAGMTKDCTQHEASSRHQVSGVGAWLYCLQSSAEMDCYLSCEIKVMDRDCVVRPSGTIHYTRFSGSGPFQIFHVEQQGL